MYPTQLDASFDSMGPSQCSKSCNAAETQLYFTDLSVLRSANKFEIPKYGFTVEFWARQTFAFTNTSQVLLLYGNTSSSLGILLGDSIIVSRCNNILSIPHRLIEEVWVHIAITFGLNDEVIVYLDGQPAFTGVLSSDQCSIPASSYLQFGRGRKLFGTTFYVLV